MLPAVQSSARILLETNQVSRRFGNRWAVASVNLRLSGGRSLLVAGHNGAGKSTLLRLLATTLRPTSGTVAVNGVPAATRPMDARRAVCMLAQRNGLYLELSALDNLRVTASMLGLDGAGDRAMQLLERVGLGGREHEIARAFSTGMRKRLAFARVLLEDTPVVLLDEPYGQLDPVGFDFVDALIGDLVAQQRAVVVVTHLIERAADLLDRGMVLQDGLMQWTGPAAELPAVFREDSA